MKMSNELAVTEHDKELIAQAMRVTRGNIGKASRFDQVPYNAMALRRIIKDNPTIRTRYYELLAEEMQESGLHIAERILKMAELQDRAFGGEYFDDEGKVRNYPVDAKTAIDISKEISRLIAEGKGQNMSAKAAVIIASKEDAQELLAKFLDS